MDINFCNQTGLECLKSLAAVIAPLITFLALIVALIAAFKDQILNWLYQPKLDIEIEMKPPCSIKTVLRVFHPKTGQTIMDAPCYFFSFASC